MSYTEKDVVREAKSKTARFCAYRERAPLEVREKLSQFGLADNEVEQILKELAGDGFYNQRRFAHAYAQGKLRLKKWGKLKIKLGLERYNIDPDCIVTTLAEINTEEYTTILNQLILSKWRSVKVSDAFIKRHKVAQFVISRGFEPDLTWRYLKEQLPGELDTLN